MADFCYFLSGEIKYIRIFAVPHFYVPSKKLSVPYFYRLITLAFITICFSAQAQNYTISGAITDAANGEELIGASIVVKEKQGIGAVTNAYGFYSLTLPKGTYNFLMRYVGYQDSTVTVVLDSNVRRNFRMNAGSTELSAVEVVGNKKENLTKAEMGVVKLSVKEMEKIPVLFGERDIMKTLQLLPGVKSAGEGNSGFFVRGGAADQNLILLDEAPVYNASHLLGFFSTFNSDVIKDVTLYKGNSPAEYGGRLSSTVDIKMKDGNDKNYVIGGGIGLIASRLNVEGPIVKDKGSFIVSGRRTYADVFLKAAKDTNLRRSVLYFYDLNVKMNYRIGQKDRLYLSGYFGRDKFGINSSSSFSINYGNVTGTLRWNHIFSEKVFSNTSVIVNNFDYGIDISTSVIGISIRSQVLDYNLKQDFQYYINSKHAIKFGFMSTMHTIKPGSVTSRDTSKVDAIALTRKYGWENGIYIQHEWKPVKQVEINYGIRLSTYTSTGPGTYYTYNADGVATDSNKLALGKFGKTYVNPEPRLAISYNFLPQHSFKTSYSRNTQNVHQLSNATIGSPTDLWVLSSNNIKTEIADQVALGYYLNFWKDRFEFSIEGYYKYLHNQIDYKNNAQLRANEQVESQLIYGTGRAYGGEFYLRKKTGKVTGWISYTLSRTERKFAGVNNNTYYPSKQDRTHDLSVVVIYQIIPRLSISGTFLYYTGNAVTYPDGKVLIDGQVLPTYSERNAYRFPAYHRFDFGLNYDLKTRKTYKHSLAFSIYNLYARKNAYTLDFGINGGDASKGISPYPEITKTYLFRIVPSISYNFNFTVPEKKKK